MNEAGYFCEANLTIDRFIGITYKTLCSTGSVPLSRLENFYLDMNNCLHENAKSSRFDLSAFSYVCNRLPKAIFNVKNVLFGQSETFLKECGVPLSEWKEVFAIARRRRYLYDQKESLVALIGSKSDLDDIIPSLLAFQIEWNKLNSLLQDIEINENVSLPFLSCDEMIALKKLLRFDFVNVLSVIKSRNCDLSIKNYEASFCRYKKETELWWSHIVSVFPNIEQRPIYFVSSNTHSLINLLSGFAESIKDEIMNFALSCDDLSSLVIQYQNSDDEEKKTILYYLLMKYETSSEDVQERLKIRKKEWEESIGIYKINSTKTLDITTQIIDIPKLVKKCKNIDVGLRLPQNLIKSNALILNIDYPLGRTAYFILSKIAEHVLRIKGVYIVGKAASLFADRGDILLPTFIADQHTRNQYYFNNCIKACDINTFINGKNHGIYDNQKAVTVLGTLLQNKEMLNNLLALGITDLEMEAGPYMSALYEILNAKRYPENESIMLLNSDIDLGIIHYVSDNPLSENKLNSSLATDGIAATYASTAVVISKIIEKEMLCCEKTK